MPKWLRAEGKEWLLLAAAAILFLSVLFFPLAIALADSPLSHEQALLNAHKSGELLRVHIVAHSDSPRDQAIKLAVRDTLWDSFGNMFSRLAADGTENDLETLQAHLPAMRLTAQKRAHSLGFNGQIQVMVKNVENVLLTIPV